MTQRNDRRQLITCLLATFALGLLAHAYAFTQGLFSHDSVMELNSLSAHVTHWKLELGRYGLPAFRLLFGDKLTLPWLNGVLALAATGVAVWLIARMFRVRSTLGCCLLAGVMATNEALTMMTATYIGDIAANSTALLLAVTAAKLWQDRRRGWLPGAALVWLALSIYQSYISVALCLAMFSCMLRLLDGEEPVGDVVRHGLLAVLMALLGGAAYWVGLQVMVRGFGVELASARNSVANVASAYRNLPRSILHTYLQVARVLLHGRAPGRETAVNGIVCALTAATLAGLAVRRRAKGLRLALAVLLAALLPLASDLSCAINNGYAHDLMFTAVWMLLALGVLALFRDGEALPRRTVRLRAALAVALALFIWNNAVLANGVYLKKDLEQRATLSLMTRVTDDIYAFEGFDPGADEVCFMGTAPMGGDMEGFEDYYDYAGNGAHMALTSPYKYRAYLRYVLNVPLKVCSDETADALYKAGSMDGMAVYPAEGSMRLIDSVLVVRMG